MNAGRKIIGLLVVYAFCFFLAAVLRAEIDNSPHYSSQQWDISDGLPHVSVQSVLQTHDGYLWIGTMKGVARFNGDSFTTFQVDNALALTNSRVTSLCETHDRTLWIGSYYGEILRLKNGQISNLNTNNPHTAAVLDIFEAHDGTVWIGTLQGAWRYKDGAFKRFDHNHLLGHVTVKKFCEDEHHTLWMGTSAGLACWTNDTLVVYGPDQGLPADFVRAVCSDRNGGIWFSTTTILGHLKNGVLTRFEKSDGLPDSNITTLYQDHQNTLWIGSYSGLSRRTGGRFYTEMTMERDPYDQVYSLTEDSEGNVWAGAKDGLYRLTQKQFISFTVQQGMANNNVTCVLQRNDGHIWFGTWGGGLQDLAGGKLNIFNSANGFNFGNDMILSLCESHDGTLWLGTDFNGGLFHFDSGKVTRIHQNDFSGRAIRAICEDHTGQLWIGTSTGLATLRGDVLREFALGNGLPTQRIRTIHEDSQYRLWLGTEKGLRLWNAEKNVFSLPAQLQMLSNNAVVEVFEDSDKILWFGTLGTGLYRFDGTNVVRLTGQQGLPSDDIYEILQDDQKNFWFSCLKGVFSISGEEMNKALHSPMPSLVCVLYDKNDGMVSSQCNGSSKPAAWKSQDGRLWFATSKGLSTITPHSLKSKLTNEPPRVMVERIAIGKRNLLDHPVSRLPEPLQVEPGNTEIEFRFAALSFRAPEKNRFRFRLIGVDPDWLDADSSRTVVYKGVRPGRYEFRVIAANSDGLWNRQGASVHLTLLPHFWQTWWFLGLTIAVSVAGVGSVVRYTTSKNLQRKLELLERQNAVQRERTRIAQDMHDDLGARLTEILFLSDVVADEKRRPEETRGHVKRISNAARELVRNLDVIVWALNPKNDSLDNFALYVYEHVENFLAPTGIRCRLDVPDELPNSPLSSEVRHNLFLVIKEALNNVAKHSCASEVWFRLRLVRNSLSISIEDNGKGFAMEKTNALGNGLVNMEKRMQSIGGCFDLNTSRDRGTQIRLQITIRNK